MSGRRPSLDDMAERLQVDPLDTVALQALVAEIRYAAETQARRFRDLGARELDDVFAEVVKVYWKRISEGTLPQEGLTGQVHVAVRRRFLSRWEAARRAPIPLSGTEDGSSPLERFGEEQVLTSDPLEALWAAWDVVRARNGASCERAWRRFWRVVDEGRTLSDVVREEDGERALAAARQAHARLVRALVAEAPPEDRELLRFVLHLRAVSAAEEDVGAGGGEA